MASNSSAMKLRYQRLKAAHICVSCGKEEAFYNMVRCPECLEKHYLSHDNDIELRRAKDNARRAKKRAIRQCLQCKEPMCEESNQFCKKHYLIDKATRARYRANHPRRKAI